MDQRSFVRRRTQNWERLETLLTRAGKRGLSSLSAGELFEFGRLYRLLTSDLAYAQGRRFDAGVLLYLNRLTARAHAFVYGANLEGGWRRAARFFVYTFPAEVRASWTSIGICVVLTVFCACVAYIVVMNRPADASALVPDSMIPAHITRSLHNSNFAFSPQRSAEMSSLIITNNIRVAVLAFAAGIVTLGVFTVYEIALNGLMLGALGALYGRAGFGTDFWVTIAPHGFIELTAIQIAGGAGLLLAAGVLLPGRLRRSEALVRNARRAGVLICGVAAMLPVAGAIEGFFSPLRFSEAVRAGMGIATAFALLVYFGVPRVEPAALSEDSDR
ncbi:MAG: stage II sporulation protein M [Candidatus Baltobacteraceae bacterium]